MHVSGECPQGLPICFILVFFPTVCNIRLLVAQRLASVSIVVTTNCPASIPMATKKSKRVQPQKRTICKGLTAKRPAIHCFQTPSDHAKFLKADLLPRAGPTHLAMALVRRTFGRRRDAVRLLKRHHIQDLHKPTAKIFMIGQKCHQGEWRPLCHVQESRSRNRGVHHCQKHAPGCSGKC